MSRSIFRNIRALAGPWLLTTAAIAQAGGGPFGLDHRLSLDERGPWARRNQLALEYGVVALELGGAIWLGNGDAVGHTLWQSVDASATSALAATALKYATSRARPIQGQGASAWFQGNGNRSFPSGEVTLQASFITPIIINHAADHPWVWSLELLPLYDGVARMKSQAHWQSDVIAGWALGTFAGYLATRMDTPISVRLLPHGLSVGYARTF